MTPDSKPHEFLLISKVAEKYRQDGYEVFIEPQRQDLPFDLGTYRPDLLVKKSENEGFVIEVKSSTSRISVERYREIAETISQFTGWRFLLITGEDIPQSHQEKTTEKLLSWEQMLDRKERGDKLILLGETEAAFLSLWGIIEALMRKQAEQMLLPVERFPTLSLIKHLYSQGELSIEQYDKAMALLNIRNRFVHGFQAPDLNSSVNQLQELVSELMHLWAPKS